MGYPCIPVQMPSALNGLKNGQLPESLLAPVKTGGKMYAPVAEEFNKMYDAALAAGHKLRNVGDYRSFESQLRMFMDRYSTTDLGRSPQVRRTYEGKYWYLKPGKAPSATPDPEGKKGSNHGWGLAIDLAYEDSAGKLRGMSGACFDWLCENAPKYGFYLQTSDRNSKWWEAWHWQYCLGDAKPDPNAQPEVESLPAEAQGNQSLRKGAKGEAVKEIQKVVGAKPVDGDWGPKTDTAVKAWQKKHGLEADGIWGNMSSEHAANCDCAQQDKKTPAKKAAPAAPAPAPAPAAESAPAYPGQPLQVGSNGPAVVLVQNKVGAKPDGRFGPATARSVRRYQKTNGLYVDGIVGPKTWGHMF